MASSYSSAASDASHARRAAARRRLRRARAARAAAGPTGNACLVSSYVAEKRLEQAWRARPMHRLGHVFVVQPRAAAAAAHGPEPDEYYNEVVADSDIHRTEQVHELERYLQATKNDGSQDRLAKLFTPDFSTELAYVGSCERLRGEFKRSIGWPPPKMLTVADSIAQARFQRVGDDHVGTYYRVHIPIAAGGVNAYGLYILPKSWVPGRKVPLVLAVHGGGGSPEGALFHGGSNYHGMVRGAVERGYAVWAPQHLFNAQGFPAGGDPNNPPIREQIDTRLRLVGERDRDRDGSTSL